MAGSEKRPPTDPVDLLPQLQQVVAGLVRRAGLQGEHAEEASAQVMARVAEVIADIEAARRERPRSMTAYIKRVCDNALAQWWRQMGEERAASVSYEERVDLEASFKDRVFTGKDERGEGEEDDGGFRVFQPKWPRALAPLPKRPYLVRLIRIASQRRPDPLQEPLRAALDDVSCDSAQAPCHPWSCLDEEDYELPSCASCPRSGPWRFIEQTGERLAELPERTARATRLYLQGVREAEIACRLGVTRGAVTQLLDRTCQRWGCDRRALETDRLRLLFANLFAAVSAALKPFQPIEDTHDADPGPDLWAWTRQEKARRANVEAMHRLTSGSARQGLDTLDVAYRQAKERAVHKAITSHEWLKAWAGGLEVDHIPRIVEFVEDHYYPDEEPMT